MLAIDIAVTGPKRDFNISQKDALEAAARGISNVVIRRLRDRNKHTSANRNGLPKSNYYAKAADSVTTVVSGSKAEVQIREPGIALHWKGGTVRPKPGKKALAIPVDPTVATIWPSEAGGIATGGSDDEPYRLIWPKGSDHGWIKDTETNDLLWLLVPKVTIPANPETLPTVAEMGEAAEKAILEMLR